MDLPYPSYVIGSTIELHLDLEVIFYFLTKKVLHDNINLVFHVLSLVIMEKAFVPLCANHLCS